MQNTWYLKEKKPVSDRNRIFKLNMTNDIHKNATYQVSRAKTELILKTVWNYIKRNKDVISIVFIIITCMEKKFEFNFRTKILKFWEISYYVIYADVHFKGFAKIYIDIILDDKKFLTRNSEPKKIKSCF